MKLDRIDGNLSVDGRFSKERINGFADAVINHFENGDGDPLRAMIVVKAQKEFISILESKLTAMAISEAEKYGVGEDRVMCGVEFQVANGRTMYDYSHDEVWSELEAQIQALKKLQKNREELMKAAMKFAGAADEQGEVIEPARVKKVSDPSLRCIIPK